MVQGQGRPRCVSSARREGRRQGECQGACQGAREARRLERGQRSVAVQCGRGDDALPRRPHLPPGGDLLRQPRQRAVLLVPRPADSALRAGVRAPVPPALDGRVRLVSRRLLPAHLPHQAHRGQDGLHAARPECAAARGGALAAHGRSRVGAPADRARAGGRAACRRKGRRQESRSAGADPKGQPGEAALFGGGTKADVQRGLRLSPGRVVAHERHGRRGADSQGLGARRQVRRCGLGTRRRESPERSRPRDGRRRSGRQPGRRPAAANGQGLGPARAAGRRSKVAQVSLGQLRVQFLIQAGRGGGRADPRRSNRAGRRDVPIAAGGECRQAPLRWRARAGLVVVSRPLREADGHQRVVQPGDWRGQCALGGAHARRQRRARRAEARQHKSVHRLGLHAAERVALHASRDFRSQPCAPRALVGARRRGRRLAAGLRHAQPPVLRLRRGGAPRAASSEDVHCAAARDHSRAGEARQGGRARALLGHGHL